MVQIIIQEEYVEAMNESMSKLAQHWKEEAERQMALATKAGATETLARLAQLEVSCSAKISILEVWCGCE